MLPSTATSETSRRLKKRAKGEGHRVVASATAIIAQAGARLGHELRAQHLEHALGGHGGVREGRMR